MVGAIGTVQLVRNSMMECPPLFVPKEWYSFVFGYRIVLFLASQVEQISHSTQFKTPGHHVSQSKTEFMNGQDAR